MTDFFNFLKTPIQTDIELEEPEEDLLNASFSSIDLNPGIFFEEDKN